MSEEVYKEIDGFKLYLVSNYGNILSNNNYKRSGPRILKPIVQADGYLHFTLCKNKKKYQMPAHRIVAQTFISNPNDKPYINHINGNKMDNRVENLEWVTSSENTQHAFKIGLMKSPKYYLGKKGELHPNSKKLRVTDYKGEIVGIYYGSAEAARELNISQASVSRYCLGYRQHEKYKFSYI